MLHYSACCVPGIEGPIGNLTRALSALVAPALGWKERENKQLQIAVSAAGQNEREQRRQGVCVLLGDRPPLRRGHELCDHLCEGAK